MHAISALAPVWQRTAPRSLSSVRLYSLALAGLTLIGFGLRLHLIDKFPFREDEAIYSFWALHFWREDPLFLTVWPDKPPLFIGLLSTIFQLVGASQASAQWLNIVISSVTIPVVGACAYQLWGRRAGLVAALTFGLNPFAISFAATAFTDPLLVLAGMLALYTALQGRAAWAGFWLGVAIMTKQQGLLYVPLVAGMLYFRFCQPRAVQEILPALGCPGDFGLQRIPHYVLRITLQFIIGLTIILLPVLYWDSLRWSVAPSPWDLSVRTYGAFAFAPIDQWPDRLLQWAELAWYLTASWPVWVVLLCGFGLKIAHASGERRGARTTPHWRHLVILSPCHLVMLWMLVLFAFHVVTTVQVWDRYLLPLAPVVALLAGWLLTRGLDGAPRWFAAGLIVWMLLLTRPALTAAAGGLPIGGDHGAYTGLIEAITWLTAEFPQDGTLYHHTLGWHHRFYLYDEVAAKEYELRWFPNAVYLADNAVKLPQRHKFLIQPDWSPVRDLAPQLAMRGLALHERYRTGYFTVYEITQRPQPFCAWCYCATPRRFPILTQFVDAGLMSR